MNGVAESINEIEFVSFLDDVSCIVRVVSTLICASKKKKSSFEKDVEQLRGDSEGTMKRFIQSLECKAHRKQRIIYVCI